MTNPPPLHGRLLPATHGAARLALNLRDHIAARLAALITDATAHHVFAPPQPGVFHERSNRVQCELAAGLALAYARLPERIGSGALLPPARRRGARPRPCPERIAALREVIAARADYPKNRSSNPLAGFNASTPPRKSARGAPAGNLNRLSHGRHARFAKAERSRLAALRAEIADLVADCNAAIALFHEAALLFWRPRTAPRTIMPLTRHRKAAQRVPRRRPHHLQARPRARTGQRAPPMATLRPVKARIR